MLNQLIVYYDIGKDPLIESVLKFINQPLESENYYRLIRMLAKEQSGVKAHLYRKILEVDHPVLLSLSKGCYGEGDKLLIEHDLKIIKQFIVSYDEKIEAFTNNNENLLMQFTQQKYTGIEEVYNRIFETEDENLFQQYMKCIDDYGYGPYALAEAFYLDGALKPIKDFSYLSWDHIYGYDHEKEKIDINTKAFIKGLPFHHVLLVGASGTGKSSSVKSLINRYKKDKLKLIQLEKKQLKDMPEVLRAVENSCYKFIVFIDDLSFEVNEDDYKFMKSFIEGGVKYEAKNVAFYITSNRRHLIKEIRSERENDIHLNDFISEMTSLSDRFGLTLFYTAPEQKLYYEMVEKMFKAAGLAFDSEKDLLEAKRWSLKHGGMSGRVAEQFVKSREMTVKI